MSKQGYSLEGKVATSLKELAVMLGVEKVSTKDVVS